MRDPGRSLEPPDTFLYTGPMSTAGRNINRFSLSLKVPDNRTAFLADPDAYMLRYELTPTQQTMVRARDWTALIKAGGHVQAVLKIAATVGENLWHVGAHNAGVPVEEMQASCPRRVGGLPENI
jgi:protocatechuate 4,5-dioxygenase alpha chain